jgi:Bacterial type II and III secretion system protein
MKTHSFLSFICFWPLALMAHAQPAIESIATATQLPLRNLLIEVRQVQSGSTQQSALETGAGVRIGDSGQISAQAQLLARQRQSQQGTTAQQQVMVFNGRNATIALRTSQPLRLLQSFVRNGRVIVAQGVAFIEAGTSFVATPRWDGTETVELSIAAEQSSAPLDGTRSVPGARSTSSAQSVLVVPMGQWTTIAQSELSSNNDAQGYGTNSASATQSSTEVQVRITVR